MLHQTQIEMNEKEKQTKQTFCIVNIEYYSLSITTNNITNKTPNKQKISFFSSCALHTVCVCLCIHLIHFHSQMHIIQSESHLL